MNADWLIELLDAVVKFVNVLLPSAKTWLEEIQANPFLTAITTAITLAGIFIIALIFVIKLIK